MKGGRDQQDQDSNVIPLARARKQAAKGSARTGAGRDRDLQQVTGAQILMSALFVALAIGGVFALAAPLLRAAGIVGG
jgi:hypothetical protein